MKGSELGAKVVGSNFQAALLRVRECKGGAGKHVPYSRASANLEFRAGG